jgi:hypothetical protein
MKALRVFQNVEFEWTSQRMHSLSLAELRSFQMSCTLLTVRANETNVPNEHVL